MVNHEIPFPTMPKVMLKTYDDFIENQVLTSLNRYMKYVAQIFILGIAFQSVNRLKYKK